VLFGRRSQLWWDLPLIESLIALRQLPAGDYAAQMALLQDLLDLGPLLEVPVRELSLRQGMRGALAATLLQRPRVLFLDEPTIGVDAVGKTRFRTFIRESNRREGVTVLLTTHVLADVEDVCARVLPIDRGRLVSDGTRAQMTMLPRAVGVLDQIGYGGNIEVPGGVGDFAAGIGCMVYAPSQPDCVVGTATARQPSPAAPSGYCPRQPAAAAGTHPAPTFGHRLARGDGRG